MSLLNEFQHGKIISLYHEKKKEKNSLSSPKDKEVFKQQFIMICDTDMEAKQKIDKICSSLRDEGYTEKDSHLLYTASQGVFDSGFLVDTVAAIENLQLTKCKPSKKFVQIVLDDIRDELEKIQNPVNLVAIDLIAESRLKIALLKGMTVVFHCSVIDKNAKIRYLKIAREIGDIECSL